MGCSNQLKPAKKNRYGSTQVQVQCLDEPLLFLGVRQYVLGVNNEGTDHDVHRLIP